MKKLILTLMVLGVTAGTASAQSALDGAAFTRQDMKGTARFMSMAGAFGALGGDITTMSYNPAGIGVYRHSEISATVDMDFMSASAEFGGPKTTTNHSRFLMNNGGYVGASNLNSDVMPNFNWGVSYNRRANFNRRFSGNAASLQNSLSDYIAGVANNSGVLQEDLVSTSSFDPYDGNNQYPAPWISILGYDSFYISPSSGNPDKPDWVGQFDSQTRGSGYVNFEEKGGIDEYNISLGGNFLNKIYWGMDVGILDLDYRRYNVWGEQLTGAYADLGNGFRRYDADWDMYNMYRVEGAGFNYKLGVIVKPIQELRIGFAFHTPTWYDLTEYYYADTNFTYSQNGEVVRSDGAKTNGGWDGENDFDFRTPWRFIASIAGVIGNNFIISADVDWTSQQYMHFSTPSYGDYYDPWGWDDWYWKPSKAGANAPSEYVTQDDPYYYTNRDVKDYYKTTTTVRVGTEYRVLPQFSLRAGYSYTTSPVRDKAKNGELTMYTADPNPSYEFEDDTNLVSFGMGYRYKAFYADLAYVWRQMSSTWHAFSPGIGTDNYEPSFRGGAIANVKSTENQVVLTAGFRF